jgi:alpha-glucosidase
MQLLGSIPTTWDETKILEARVSDYIITARKKGSNWFVGGMTDWTAREFSIPLEFLDEGSYDALLCKDGVNAGSYPSDYVLQSFTIKKGDTLPVQMAPGGGFLLRLVKR